MGKKKIITSKGREANAFVKSILNVFQKNPGSSFNYKQVAQRLGVVDRGSKDLVRLIVEELFMGKNLIQTRRGKFQINEANDNSVKGGRSQITGIVDMKQTGKAYIIPEDKSGDIFISSDNTFHALNGDTVMVNLFPLRKGYKREGEIVEIIKRKKKQFVGTIELSKKFAFMIPDSNSMPVDIFIPISQLNGARQGEKVVAAITEWPAHAENPFGEVLRVLGKPGDNKVEMQSILAEHEFPLSFSPQAEKEASRIPVEILDSEAMVRRDFRNVLTITIDPEDAKDFDDAISLQPARQGRWEVGIHIADVSYYVKPGSIIDQEAYERATSIYMVGRTIPMLPERLSNEVCSLQPNKDRLCFSAVFEMDEQGKIYNEWYGKTIIHSNRRFSYDEVQSIIESGDGEYSKEIAIFNRLATRLREERFGRGAINFETQEVRFNLDEDGKPLSIYIREMKDANKLIEDFMLLANRKVAEKIGKKAGDKPVKTFVYRVHDEPTPEKLDTFTQFIERLGYQLKLTSKKSLAQSFNNLFQEIKGTGTENMIETIAIRTMAKAYYSTSNIGHYGLSFPFYTHFTSPIRRYPDLMVHRLFWDYLHDAPSVSKESYEPRCDHSSEMERRATEAERMSVKYKQAEYMLDKIGQVFDGVISGVSKWGIFVEIIGTKCEGMIRLRDMGDDFYYLDEENFQVIGQRLGYQFKLGDKIKIRVKKIDLGRKQMDYDLVR
jgi:ribonuclease R